MKNKHKNVWSSVFLVAAILLLVSIWIIYPIVNNARAESLSPPILVIVNDNFSENPYGRYLEEILRTEGLNEFDILDISTVTAADISQYSLVILAQTPLNAAQSALLTDYVNAGGRLLAMRPDSQIYALFGIQSSQGSILDGYTGLNHSAIFNGTSIADGLPTLNMQIHGEADLYNQQVNSVVLAQLYSDSSTQTLYPSVIGSENGKAVAFSYDVVSNVILTRQGNPANANVDVDGDGLLRTIDLFQSPNNGQPWIDRDRIIIPQADEQQRFFVRIVHALLGDALPLPQLWYFPNRNKTLMVITGDAHANPDGIYQSEINTLNNYGAKATFYIAIAGNPSDSTMQAWRAQGYEFGIHPYAYRPDSYPPYNITNLPEGYSVFDYWYGLTFTSPKSRTVRNHQIAWLGWTDAAELAANYGIALDTDFYHWGSWLQKPDGTWPHGYITGSGQPMKFISSNGSIIDNYQLLTTLVDEQILAGARFENLSSASAIALSKSMIDASQAGDYAAIMTQFHVDYFYDAQSWIEGTLAYAQSLGIPMWDADTYLDFIETRYAANYTGVNWDVNTGNLTFNLEISGSPATSLTTLLPLTYNGRNLVQVTVDGNPVNLATMNVKGRDLAAISTTAEVHTFLANYQINPNTPTPVNSATPTSVPTATQTSIGPTNTVSPTPTGTPNTPTITPVPTSYQLVHSSYTDFTAICAVPGNVVPSDLNGGSLTLASTFYDDFPGTSIDSNNWSFGPWDTGLPFIPTVNNSILQVPTNGWVRSQNTNTHASLDVVAEFGLGPWQHIGFASDGFESNRYFIFSTFNSSGNLFVRVNNNSSEQNINLGPIPTGLHSYRVEWEAQDSNNDIVRFYVDHVNVAQFVVTNVGAANLYAYLSNNGSVDLIVDSIAVSPPFNLTGSYTSCELDAGSNYSWDSIGWASTLPADTTLDMEVRTSANGVDWSGWGSIPAGGGVFTEPQRYLQYQVTMSTANSSITPILDSITLSASMTSIPTSTATAIPTPTNTSIAPTFTSTPTQTATPVNTLVASLTPTVTSLATLTPTATAVPATATATATATAVPTFTSTPLPASGFPSTNILDDFNRTGALGVNWTGSTSGYMLSGNQLVASSGDDIYWATPYGADQEVFVNLTNINPGANEIDLLLKSQNVANWKSGLIEIIYNPSSSAIQVWTYAPGQKWVLYGNDIPITLVAGDQLGARATSNGQVIIYQNSVEIAARNISTWSFAGSGGYVGVWIIGGSGTALDNFGGGNASLLPSPTPTITLSPTPIPPSPTTDPALITPTPTLGASPTTSIPTDTPTPTITPSPAPSLTPTNTAVPGAFPVTSILDNFNRTNGALGSYWGGSIGGYVVAGNQLDVASGGDIYWTNQTFGPNQEVYVRLTSIDTSGNELDLMLKAQNPSQYYYDGVLEVYYDPSGQIAQVWSFAPSQGWLQHGDTIPLNLTSGDQFGARMTADGLVSVYKNGVLVAVRDASTWPFASGNGYIGLWYIDGSASLADDFGGGTVP